MVEREQHVSARVSTQKARARVFVSLDYHKEMREHSSPIVILNQLKQKWS